MGEIEVDKSEALTVHLCGEAFTYIFLRPDANAGTIAHEAWHAVHHLLEDSGVELDHECTAYHLGYLVNRIHEFFRRRK